MELERVKREKLLVAAIICLPGAGISVFQDFPGSFVFVAFLAYFFPGYVLAYLILGELDFVESIVYGFALSMGLIVFSILLLQTGLGFSFTRETVAQAAILSSTLFLALFLLRRYLSEAFV